jgi:hypothetical protein
MEELVCYVQFNINFAYLTIHYGISFTAYIVQSVAGEISS